MAAGPQVVAKGRGRGRLPSLAFARRISRVRSSRRYQDRKGRTCKKPHGQTGDIPPYELCPENEPDTTSLTEDDEGMRRGGQECTAQGTACLWDHSGSALRGGEILLFVPALLFVCVWRLAGFFLLLFGAGGGGSYSALRTRKVMDYKLIVESLQSNDEQTFLEAWRQFFMNADAVSWMLKNTPVEQVKLILQAGDRWSGVSWDTTRAAKTWPK